MKRCVRILVIAGLLTGWLTCLAEAEIVIKVRALNPLDTQETAVINYPLPKEVTESDILKQNITYSMDHFEDEEPPKNRFQISFDEERGELYVDDSVVLLPKEVVTLEVHVKDVWVIEESQINQLKENVIDLLKDWDEHSKVMAEEIEDASQESEDDVENTEDIAGENVENEEVELDKGDGENLEEENKEETKEFALVMKEEILKGLDDILKRQNDNTIISVGVERHIAAYEENIDAFTQVQQDIVLLANLIQFDMEESEEALQEESPEENNQDSNSGDGTVVNEEIEGVEIIGDVQDLE